MNKHALVCKRYPLQRKPGVLMKDKFLTSQNSVLPSLFTTSAHHGSTKVWVLFFFLSNVQDQSRRGVNREWLVNKKVILHKNHVKPTNEKLSPDKQRVQRPALPNSNPDPEQPQAHSTKKISWDNDEKSNLWGGGDIPGSAGKGKKPQRAIWVYQDTWHPSSDNSAIKLLRFQSWRLVLTII